MRDLSYFDALGMYDVIWACGSLHNAPRAILKQETTELLKHLKVGARWIQLAVPKERWTREGKMPFREWGTRTDGGAPWEEWYDLEKLLDLLKPAEFKVAKYMNYHNDDFNWFDLIRVR